MTTHLRRFSRNFCFSRGTDSDEDGTFGNHEVSKAFRLSVLGAGLKIYQVFRIPIITKKLNRSKSLI